MKRFVLLLPLLAACPASVEVVRQPPTVDAGIDQEVAEGETVTLAAAGQDFDGATDTLTWSWSVHSGPDVELQGGGTASPSFVAPGVRDEVDLVLAATATDAEGLSGTDWTVVTIRSLNEPPTVDAGAPQVVAEGEAFALSGTAEDVDGTVESLTWSQVAGPEATGTDDGDGGFDGTAPAVAERTELVFELLAVDDDGAEGRDVVTVIVLSDNLAPVVDAGEEQTVDEQTTVALDGSATDDGTVASTEWTQLQGPAVVFSDASGLAATFEAPAVTTPTNLLLQLTATDDEGAVGIDLTSVLVLPVNPAPVVDAGPDQDVDEQTEVTLAGSATDDGAVASLEWVQLSGPTVALTDATTDTATFDAPAVTAITTLAFALTATDHEGALGTDLVLVHVAPVNPPPVVDAGPDQSVFGLDAVQLAGSATDDGAIVSTEWDQVSGTLVSLSALDVLNPTFDAPDVAVTELLVFQLTATDDEGAVASDTVTVEVQPLVPINQAPVAFAGSDQQVASGSSVQLNGSATDPDGTIASYAWNQLSGPTVSLSSTSDPAGTFVAPVVDCPVQIVLELTVTDDDGAVDSDVVAITVLGQTGAVWPLGTVEDLESDDGLLITEGATWEHGVPTNGPGGAWDGSQVWATSLSGNYPSNASEFLCLPAVERGAGDLVLAFRLWAAFGSGDALTVEALSPTAGWTRLDDVAPAYEGSSLNGAGWQNQRYLSNYALMLVEVPSWAGDPGLVRLTMHSNNQFGGNGAYIDAFSTHDEGDDPDGDGLVGLFAEQEAWGTDPLLFDTDGDGAGDGDEVTAGTDPLDPADFPGAVFLLPGDVLDFEQDGGGLATDGTLWEHGNPSQGPATCANGSQCWATEIDGNYFSGAREFLYLPPVDLTTATDPTLYTRMWSSIGNGDGASLEYFDPVGGWSNVLPATPDYDASDTLGFPAWRNQRYLDDWSWGAVPLDALVGDVVSLRWAFRSDTLFGGAGFYFDDLAIEEEAADPDGDGLVGVVDEWAAWGTDPYTADTDGDGSNDGDEVAAGTDPLNPADHPAVVFLLPGDVLDFEGDDGGLSTDGTLWEHGSVSSGPGTAWSGSSVWATNASGNYFSSAREELYLPPIDLTAATAPTLGFRAWFSAGNGDGVGIEWWDGSDWARVMPTTPEYESVDTLSRPAWRDQNYKTEWVWVGVDLSPWVGDVLSLRFTFASDTLFGGSGAYIDDLTIQEEATDFDGDGVAGLLDERALLGSDPDVADTDGDGADDGAEDAAGTNALNPAAAPLAAPMVPGEQRFLDADNGGLATRRTLWSYGGPSSGPQSAHTGSLVWATNPSGNYASAADERVYLPVLDLTASTAPTLSFRLWHDRNNGDGTYVEVLDPVAGWQWIDVDEPAYGTTVNGVPCWDDVGVGVGYELAAIDLTPWAGLLTEVRLRFRSDSLFGGTGAYIDDLGLHDEGDDPDGDGLLGVLDEYVVHGTDPFVADTDGDGVDDGAEVGAGTDPLDPASN
jgi:hypothetical protein